jgi:hypothetical protein
MAKAGRVQSEIAKLPAHLQAFGMYCWAPKEQDTLPTYKHHNEIANALAREIKEKFPQEYSYYTSRVSIVVLNVLKYEFERDKGRKPQNIDITLSGAMAMSKEKVQAQWGHIIKHIRCCIRDMHLATDTDKNLSIGILHLLKEWQTQTGAEATEKHSVIASLALKSFAHQDQAYLFSASEERKPVKQSKPLYTQEYLSWRVGVAQANWRRDGWQDALDQMTTVLNQWARESLETISIHKKASI